MLQFLSIYLLLSIKCFHFRTTGPSSKRHLNAHRYTIQIKSYLVQWLHVLEPQCSLWSGFGVCHPLDSEEEIIYLSKNYCFQKHSGWWGREGWGWENCCTSNNLQFNIFYCFGFCFPATKKIATLLLNMK